jgi:hypothetical protein
MEPVDIYPSPNLLQGSDVFSRATFSAFTPCRQGVDWFAAPGHGPHDAGGELA